jgi:hypothetical protein
MSEGRKGTARELWAHTRLRVGSEALTLVSLPVSELPAAAALLAGARAEFAALVLERDEVSLSVPAVVWEAGALRERARAAAGPYRALTLDLDLDLGVVGYLAPAAERLAAAGISIVPQCAFLKDHLLVREADLAHALVLLQELIDAAESTA